MTMRLDYRFAILLQALFVAPLGCLEPTQAFVEITTDSSCSDLVSTGISAGLLDDIEKKGSYDTSTTLCSNSGEIGSIVLVPPDGADKKSPFAFNVVGSLGTDVEACVPPEYGPGCIVARRAMRFVPHRPFRVPVHLGQACAGVVCPDEQTCVDGICRSATIDPYDCETAETCVPVGGDAPPWQKAVTGQGLQMVRHIATHDNGTIVVTGAFDNMLNLGGKPLVSKGSTDVFLAALTQGGLHKWSFSFGSSQVEDTSRVAIGPDGAVFMAVGFQESIDFGGGELVSAGSYDVALAKFTHFGKLQWAIRFGGPSSDSPTGLVVDHEGNVIVSGSFSESAEVGDQIITSNGQVDAIIARFTPTGNLLWTKVIGGPLTDGGTSVGVDPSGRVYVAGYVDGEVTFAPNVSITSLNLSDGFVASYEATGQFRWVQKAGTQSNDRIADLVVRDDRVVVTGTIGGAGEIAGKPLESAEGRGLVAAFDTSGTLIWAQRFGQKVDGKGAGVAFAGDGSIVLGGEMVGGAIFGSEPPTLDGYAHPFVAILEPDGAPRWARVFSSSHYASTSSVAAAANGFAYIAGWFADDLAIGEKYLSSVSAEDGFLLRVTQPPPPDMSTN